MTIAPTRIETEAERAFREGAEALIARASPEEARVRRAALDAFVAQGLPDRRQEDFHFTDLRVKLRDAYPPVAQPRSPSPQPPPRKRGGGENLDSLDSLNRALTHGGEAILVAPGETRTVALEPASFPSRASVHPRHVVEVGKGARLALVERHEPSNDHLTNEHLEIAIGEGAQVEHIKLLMEGDAAHLAGTNVSLAVGASYRATTLALGTRLARHAVRLSFEGEGAGAAVRSVALLKGDEHVDFNIRVEHIAPHCTSDQEARIVALDRARGVAQGLVRVAAGGTDARQLIRGLIVGERAEIDAKPELEILNDDVKASHGTAIGDLDPEAIFYLRSRGVPEAQARALLVEAFLAELLDKVAHDGARALLWERTREWLARSLSGDGCKNA